MPRRMGQVDESKRHHMALADAANVERADMERARRSAQGHNIP